MKRYSEAIPFSLLAAVPFACVQTSPISFGATKEIGDVCTQATVPSSAISLLAGFFRSSALTESLVQASFVHDAEVYSGTSIKSTLATPERASSS